MFKFASEMKDKSVDIIEPINQLSLYGYERYFDLLTNLFGKDKLPNSLKVIPITKPGSRYIK